MENTKINTRRLVISAVMIALASVLSLIKVYQLPLGGSITLLSMLPIVLLSVKFGPRWGLFSAFVYALVQFALDLPAAMSWGMTPGMWVGCIVFDYLLAFTVLGLAGIFRNKGPYGLYIGIALALVLRFVCHFISGTVIFATWAQEGWNVALYSIVYNGSFMLPELIFTLLGALVLFKLPQTQKLLLD